MPVDIEDLINVLAQICEDRNLRAAFKGSVKGGLITGVSATIGGLIFGPLGLLIGGTIGGGVSTLTSEPFRPVSLILREMKPAEKKKLYDMIMHAFRNFGINDVITISTLVLAGGSYQDIAIREVSNYLNNQMNLRVTH